MYVQSTNLNVNVNNTLPFVIFVFDIFIHPANVDKYNSVNASKVGALM